MVCLSACVTVAATGRAHENPAVHRVRSEQQALAAVIAEGISRSKRFAGLVEAVDQTDGLVYIEEGACGNRVRACLVMSIVNAGPYRMLRIQVHPHRPRRQLIAAIGHELHHALEVLSEPGIRSNDALVHFYLRTAPSTAETFETPAAIRAGLDVFAELGADEAAKR